jgi:sugar/nucleoside kinase (ribokinase family)
MTDIVAIGEPMIEFNQTVPGEPQYLQGFGGDTSNFSIAAARQGARGRVCHRGSATMRSAGCS